MVDIETKVEIDTEFVYEYKEDGYAAERGVNIAKDVTPHTEVLSIPPNSTLTVQLLQEIVVLQRLVYPSSSYLSERTINCLLLCCTRSLCDAANPASFNTLSF